MPDASPVDAWFRALADRDPVVGGLAVASICALVIVIRWWRDDNRKFQELITALNREYADLARSVSNSVNKVADATNDRNDATDRLTEAINRQAEATATQVRVQELTTDRIMDRFGGLEQVQAAMSTAIRELDRRAPR